MPAANASDHYLWLRPQRPPRSPQPQLTREQIAAAAIAVADEGGDEAVSMRNIAARLGCGTMSLYRHVRNKDELLDVMIDAVLGEDGGPPTAPSGDWRADLRHNAWRMRDQVLRHPWLPRLRPRRPLLGPNMLASTEYVLSAVDGLGLSMDEMVGVIRTVEAFVVGFTQNELAEREWRRPASEQDENGWHIQAIPYIQHIVGTGAYPRFTRMVIEAEDFPRPDAVFEWQLERVLDGLAAAIPAPAPRPTARSGAPRPQAANTQDRSGIGSLKAP